MLAEHDAGEYLGDETETDRELPSAIGAENTHGSQLKKEAIVTHP